MGGHDIGGCLVVDYCTGGWAVSTSVTVCMVLWHTRAKLVDFSHQDEIDYILQLSRVLCHILCQKSSRMPVPLEGLSVVFKAITEGLL